MNIKCPNCETAYDVPDSKIGNKPRKMRCSRCDETFTVKRRDNEVPEGYQEFTGRQESLPKEFSFLKASPEKLASLPPMARPSNVPSSPDEGPVGQGNSGSGFESFAPSHKATQPGFGAGNLSVPTQTGDHPAPKPIPVPFSETENAVQPPSLENALINAQNTDDSDGENDATIPFKTHVENESQQQQAAAVVRPAPATPVLNQSNGADMFRASAWETEAPLELGSYAAPTDKSQKIGKIMAIFSGVVILLLLFVVYRNGWSLSLSKLPEQFAFAFSGAAREVLPDAVDDLETTIAERYIRSFGSKSYLVVNGTVFNNAPLERSRIMLRGKLFDASGDLQAEAKAPCGVPIEDDSLKEAKRGQVYRLYQRKGRPYNCRIRQESSSPYQLVFETPPTDYSDNYSVEVTPIFAE